MARILGVLVIAVAVLAPPAHARAPQAMEMNALDMLNLYEGDRALAVASFGDHLHLDSIWDEIKKKNIGEHWIAANGKADENRRRLLLATFVIEVINLEDPDEWSCNPAPRRGPAPPAAPPFRLGAPSGGAQPPPSAVGPCDTVKRMIEWVCSDLRDQRLPPPLERTWHMAVEALLEHLFETANDRKTKDFYRAFLAEHTLHAESRFPNEGRWLLIRAWLADHEPPPLGLVGPCGYALMSDHIWETCDAMFFDHTEDKYEKAMAAADVAAEARVEFARLHLKREHWDTVLMLLNEADRLTKDPELRYLAFLMEGFAYDAKHDPRHATGAFQLALNAVPRAQTAAINLASDLLLDGARDSASRLLDAALTNPADDPWLLHNAGEYRNWPKYIGTLRKDLK